MAFTKVLKYNTDSGHLIITEGNPPKNEKFERFRYRWSTRHKIILDTRLFKICDTKEAVILSYLIEKFFENDGQPFAAGTQEMYSYTGIKESSEQRSISILKNNGLIRVTKTKTIPSRRLVEVLIGNLEKKLRELEGQNNGEKLRLKNIQKPTQVKLNDLHNGSSSIRIVNYTHTLSRRTKDTPNSSKIYGSKIEKNGKIDNEFIPSKTTRKSSSKINVNNDDLTRAEALVKGLSKKSKINGNYSTKKWAVEFAKIRDIDGIEDDTISSVLNWYIENIGEPYTPHAFSGKSFRSKFQMLLRGYERNKPVTITKSVVPLSEELSSFYSWPKGSKREVPIACQITFNSYVKFYNSMVDNYSKIKKKYLPDTYKEQRVWIRQYCDFLKKNLPTPIEFVKMWMIKVNDRIQNWDKFNGEIKMLAWNGNVDNKLFYNFIMSLGFMNADIYWEHLKGIITL